MSGHADYLTEIFTPDDIIERFVKVVPPAIMRLQNIAFVGIGLSGTAALFILLQAKLISKIAVVRKGKDNTHSCRDVEHNLDYTEDLKKKPWVFVDDFISSGETVNKAMYHFNRDKLVGAYLYHGYGTPEFASARQVMEKVKAGGPFR